QKRLPLLLRDERRRPTVAADLRQIDVSDPRADELVLVAELRALSHDPPASLSGDVRDGLAVAAHPREPRDVVILGAGSDPPGDQHFLRLAPAGRKVREIGDRLPVLAESKGPGAVKRDRK